MSGVGPQAGAIMRLARAYGAPVALLRDAPVWLVADDDEPGWLGAVLADVGARTSSDALLRAVMREPGCRVPAFPGTVVFYGRED